MLTSRACARPNHKRRHLSRIRSGRCHLLAAALRRAHIGLAGPCTHALGFYGQVFTLGAQPVNTWGKVFSRTESHAIRTWMLMSSSYLSPTSETPPPRSIFPVLARRWCRLLSFPLMKTATQDRTDVGYDLPSAQVYDSDINRRRSYLCVSS